MRQCSGTVGFVFLTVFALAQVVGCCPGLTESTLVHDNQNRTYCLHEPANVTRPSSQPLPLVVVLHGAWNDGCDVARMSEFNDKADSNGFLVAYPNSTGILLSRTWNAGVCCPPATDNGVDDVGFVDAVIAEIENAHNDVDSDRIYIAGFSNGAMLAYEIAHQLPGRVAAIAAVAGTMEVASRPQVSPVSVVVVHGDDDGRVDYDGGDFSSPFGSETYPTVQEVVDFWVSNNSCSPVVSLPAVGSATVMFYQDNTNGKDVMLYRVGGGNHSWPGGQSVSAVGQTPVQDVPATDLIWDFFEQHPR